jgi:hypothetical protein
MEGRQAHADLVATARLLLEGLLLRRVEPLATERLAPFLLHMVLGTAAAAAAAHSTQSLEMAQQGIAAAGVVAAAQSQWLQDLRRKHLALAEWVAMAMSSSSQCKENQ